MLQWKPDVFMVCRGSVQNLNECMRLSLTHKDARYECKSHSSVGGDVFQIPAFEVGGSACSSFENRVALECIGMENGHIQSAVPVATE